MIPIKVPFAAHDHRPQCDLVSMGPPPGIPDEECGTVQMLVERPGAGLVNADALRRSGARAHYAYYRPSEAELDDLRAGGFIEFAQFGSGVQPFSAAVWPAGDPA